MAIHPAVHHRVEILSHTRPFQNHGHKNEKRNGQKGEFPHGAVGLGRRYEKTFFSPQKKTAHHPHSTQDKRQGKSQGQ